MKTTIEIGDALLNEARKVAAREKSTLKALVEEGLRRSLDERRRGKAPFILDLVTVKGRGTQPGVDWELPRHLAYDLPENDER